MKNKMKKHYIYVNITEQSVALMLIADILSISKYRMFLLYETFGNDVFLFFDLLQKAGHLKPLSDFRVRRCFQYAKYITPVLLGSSVVRMSSTEQRAYRQINPYLFENKLRIEEDRDDS